SPDEARSMCTFQPADAGWPPGLVSKPTPPVPGSQELSSNPSVCQVLPSELSVGTSALSGAVGPMNGIEIFCGMTPYEMSDDCGGYAGANSFATLLSGIKRPRYSPSLFRLKSVCITAAVFFRFFPS